MKTSIVLMLLVGVSVVVGAQERLADQLRKGVVQEETAQNLDKAIQTYQSIVEQFDADRKAAATALYRLGECYRKAGKREPAVTAYQRVLREFADQKALVESSRKQLTEAYGVTESRAAREDAEVVQLRKELAETRKTVQVARAREAERTLASAPSDGRITTAETARVELTLLERRLADIRRKVEAGLTSPDDLKELTIQYEAAKLRYEALLQERQQQEYAAQTERTVAQETLKSIQMEMQLVQERITEIEKKISVGVVSATDPELLQLKRDLLGLQRKAAEVRGTLRR